MYDELEMLLKNFGVQSEPLQPEPSSERKLVDIMALKLKNLIDKKI